MMSFLSFWFCFSLLLAAAGSQHPEPCIAPPLMTGGVTVMSDNGHMTLTGTMSYDALGQRMMVSYLGDLGNQTIKLDQLMLFNQEIYYEIDWSNHSCKKMKLNASFIPMQVPSDAKLMNQVILGSSSSFGMGMLTNIWYGHLPHDGVYMTMFTEIGCIPVTFTSYSPRSGSISISTFNWVIGLSNPIDFFPPSICHKSKLEETETPHNFFTVMESLAKKTRRVE